MPGPEADAALVIDACVLINLLDSGAAEEVLASLPQAVPIEHRALSECPARPEPESARARSTGAVGEAPASSGAQAGRRRHRMLQCPSIRRSAIHRFVRG